MSTPKTLQTSALFLLVSLAASIADEGTFIQNARQLTLDGLRSGEGYFRPDGKALVFQSERDADNPFYQIYSLSLESGDTRRVSVGKGKTTCAFFQPGSDRLLYSSTHEDPDALKKQKDELAFRASGKTRRYSWDYDPTYEIYSAKADGTDIQRLTNSPGYDAEASYSPDGKLIVFSSTRGAYPLEKLSAEDRARFDKDPAYFADLYVMNADGSNVRQITNTPGYDGGPFFSPDGGRILWRRFDSHGMNADLFSVRVDGTDVRKLTDFGCMSWAPYYHPSGEYLIFTSNKLGFENFELFIVDTAGEKEPVRVTTTDGFDGLPVFSPDGKRLCWTTNRGSEKKSQLFLGDWDHAAALKAVQASPARKTTGAVSEQAKTETAPLGGGTTPVAGQDVKLPESEFAAEVRVADLKKQVEWLAAPEREGRRTGSPGAAASADWVADYLKRSGVDAIGGGYFQGFEYPAGVALVADHNSLKVSREGKDLAFQLDKDFRPLPFSDSGVAEGEVVFAGYGLSVPEGNGSLRYNSYDGLDVQDKIVVLLRYVPEGVDATRRAQLNHYAGLRYKAMLARERGAKAVLVVAGPNSPQSGELLALTSDGSMSDSGIVAHSIGTSVAEALLAGVGKSLKEVQTALDDENPHVAGGFPLKGVTVRLEAGVEHRKGKDRNVLGVIPPGPGGTDEWIVVGAHYDHLGRGAESNSMARSGEEKGIHHGADDNASGTAVVMELAAALAQERKEHGERFKRGVVFGFWSGEEMGLIGSAGFCEKPLVDLKKCVAYVNFDMVGRLRENKLTLQGIGSSKTWKRLIERRNVASGFNLMLQEDPYLPTDTTSFYPKRIPVLNFFTGSHEDYHRPTDTPDKIEFNGMERIAKFASGIVLDLAEAPERPDFSRVERTAQQESGSRETLRAYIGSIPDYSTEVTGVKLSGVRGGSPAEKGGLQGGDVIVEFGPQKVKNIYDYTFALDAVKIGHEVNVVVLRDGKRVELKVTPEARK
ncbi:MAG: M28 family peptidase [Verrucomicrobiota bacterium]